MNEELTNEVLEAMKKCSGSDCAVCDAYNYCNGTSRDIVIEALATSLLEERAKPKDDVWEYAPDGITTAEVHYGDDMIVSATPDHTFTRELPKTRAREIIENPDCPFKSCQFWDDNADGKCGGELHGGSAQETCKWYTDYESALTKYAEELEEKE